MPKEDHRRAAKYCRSKGYKPGTDRWDECVYGVMKKIAKNRKKGK